MVAPPCFPVQPNTRILRRGDAMTIQRLVSHIHSLSLCVASDPRIDHGTQLVPSTHHTTPHSLSHSLLKFGPGLTVSLLLSPHPPSYNTLHVHSPPKDTTTRTTPSPSCFRSFSSSLHLPPLRYSPRPTQTCSEAIMMYSSSRPYHRTLPYQRPPSRKMSVSF